MIDNRPNPADALDAVCLECAATITDARLDRQVLSGGTSRHETFVEGPWWVILWPCGHEIRTGPDWQRLLDTRRMPA